MTDKLSRQQKEGGMRCDRELLRTWLAWWDGPARDWGLHDLPVIPPITDTRELLKCSLCQGIEADGVCEACGRVLFGPTSRGGG